MALTVDAANAILRGNFAPWVLELGRSLAFGEVLIAAEGSAETAVQVSSTCALVGAKP